MFAILVFTRGSLAPGLSLEYTYRVIREKHTISEVAEVEALEHALLDGDLEATEYVFSRFLADSRHLTGRVSDIVGELSLEIPAIPSPSFRKLELSESHTPEPTRFFDAFPPSVADIAAGYTVSRQEYTQDLKEKVFSHWKENEPFCVILSGSAGSGKTVMSLQLAYDCMVQDIGVYRLLYDWRGADPLSTQIVALKNRDPSAYIFIFDNAGSLIRNGVRVSDLISSVQEYEVPVCLVFIENWPLVGSPDPSRGASGKWVHRVTLDAFRPNELGQFVDRILQLEASGQIEARSTLSRNERLEKLSTRRNSLPAVALPMLRYGKEISSILEAEFNSIQDTSVKFAYGLVILFACVQRRVTATLLENVVDVTAGFWSRLSAVTQEEDGMVSPRHFLFGPLLLPLAIPDARDRMNGLISILEAVDGSNSEIRDFHR